ncbi:hypothetical protein QJS10_CPB17g02647 [Acorus calamus]|uniref:Uncharacterized protein n=1 Tax=Acorus calamus TaxID=4465 RepID=A0AAV9CTL0_ACOCL|nr:hypothetical protein QJS10_CPB17g02647 [Acorus calamus]
MLVALCVWVVYFVKHLQLKKTAFNEKNKSTYDKIEEQMIDSSNLGWKDLSREIPVTITETGNQNKEEEPDEEKFQNQDEEQKVNGMKNNGTENTKSAMGDVEKNNETRQENIVLLNPVMAVEGRETVEIKSNMTPPEAEDDIQLPNNMMKGELEVHLEPLNNSMTVESTDHAESQRNPTTTEPQSKTRTMAENENPGVYNSSNLESLSSSAQNETLTQDETSSVQVETRGEDHYESYDSLFS